MEIAPEQLSWVAAESSAAALAVTIVLPKVPETALLYASTQCVRVAVLLLGNQELC